MAVLVTLVSRQPDAGPDGAEDPLLASAAIAVALRSAVASAAARDWLETQARVVEYWRDLLADVGEAGELIEALDAHAAFLNGVVARG